MLIAEIFTWTALGSFLSLVRCSVGREAWSLLRALRAGVTGALAGGTATHVFAALFDVTEVVNASLVMAGLFSVSALYLDWKIDR